MRGRLVGGLGLLRGVAACHADSQAVLARETGSLAPVGAPPNQAMAALGRAGFTCGNNPDGGVGAAPYECDRLATLRLFATCVQRVFLGTTATARTVSRVTVRRPACVGP